MGSELVARDCSSGRSRTIGHSRLGAGRKGGEWLCAGAHRSGRGVRNSRGDCPREVYLAAAMLECGSYQTLSRQKFPLQLGGRSYHCILQNAVVRDGWRNEQICAKNGIIIGKNSQKCFIIPPVPICYVKLLRRMVW